MNQLSKIKELISIISSSSREIEIILSELQHEKTNFRLFWPTEHNQIVQGFGGNTTGVPDFYTRFGLPAHEGADFKAPLGSAIFCCADGIVSRIERVETGHAYGIQIRINHSFPDGEFETIYAHLQSVDPTLKVHSTVKRGQKIGTADSTGNSFGSHLHLTLKKRGATVRGEKQRLQDGRWVVYPSDIVDPTPYLDPFGIN